MNTPPRTPFDRARMSATGLAFALMYQDCPLLENAVLECAMRLLAGEEPPKDLALPPQLKAAITHMAMSLTAEA